jgi:release factor glutamine methyltransferase
MVAWTPPQRTLRDALVDAERRLRTAAVPSPRTDAELLLAHVLGVPRGRMFLSDPIEATDQVRFEALVVKRVARVPLQHLLGEAPFRHLTLAVGRGVFVPRPETEAVTELALRALRADAQERLAVDLCTGSGAIALALATEVPHTLVHAVELDPAAHEWAARNIEAQAELLESVGSRVVLHHADATTAHVGALATLVGRVDVVVSNPPYIPDGAIPRDPEVREHDPHRALYGGPDGLEVVRGVIDAASALLRPGGTLVIEHGDDQGESGGVLGVPAAVREHGGFAQVSDHPDLAGRDRATVAVRRTPGSAP